MPKRRPSLPAAAPDPLPSAAAVAERYARITGQANAAPSHYAPARDVRADFVVGGVGYDHAKVQVASRSMLGGVAVQSPVGYFNPATQRWVFYPEYVDRRGMPPLAKHYNTLIPRLGASIEVTRAMGGFAVDSYHALTHKVRKGMAAYLARLGPDFLRRAAVREALDRVAHEPTPVVRADDVVPYIVLGGEVTLGSVQEQVGLDDTITRTQIVGPVLHDQAVILSLVGVQVQHPDFPRGTMRDIRSVRLADRDWSEPDLWVPHTDVLRPEEWTEAVHPCVELVGWAAQQNTNFSPRFAAVAYNAPEIRNPIIL